MYINFPVEDTKISQPFGFDNTSHPERHNFYTIFGNRHPGVDFPVSVGTPVYASFSGVVVRREFHNGMGNVLGIRNGNIVSLYAHLASFNANLGAIVTEGSLIGISGDTGAACIVPHLHFELRDLTKKELSEMVFNPPFNLKCLQYRPNFSYIVNNTNTSKTLSNLSVLFFGSSEYANAIASKNYLSKDINDVLQHGIKLVIPNYAD